MSQDCKTFFKPKSLCETAVFCVRSGSLARVDTSDLRSAWEECLTSSSQAIFFYHVIIKSIDAYLARDYTLFDAHTTTNCCHGIAIFAREQVVNFSHLDVDALKLKCLEKMRKLESDSTLSFCTQWVPETLFNLAALYTLAITRKFLDKRMQTDVNNLKDIYSVSTKFCRALTSKLRKTLSNIVAYGYKDFLDDICPSTELHQIPIQVWGRYVQPNYIRSDKRNVHYAPCIFSNQISLTHLVSSKAKVALVNDIVDSCGQVKSRYVCLFQGNGKDKLLPIEGNLDTLNPHEPVVVFGGYVHSDLLTIEELAQKLVPWLHDFQKLMLACDLFYPHFPTVKDDPNFNSHPISPKEPGLQELFDTYAQVSGVSALDPTLYCASHIYPASLGQLLKTMQDQDLSVLSASFHGIHPSREV